MAKRDNHYEQAFSAYLRARQVALVAVNEIRRSVLGPREVAREMAEVVPAEPVPGQSLKSLDFIVAAPGSGRLLVDVKGRRFPSGGTRYWTNWSTRDDLVSLARWERLLGPGSQGLFVFAYHLVGDRSPLPAELLFEWHQRRYAFLGVRLRDYAAFCRPLSPRWDTWTLPAALFRRLARPLESFFEPAARDPREAYRAADSSSPGKAVHR